MKTNSISSCRYIWDIIPENLNAKSFFIQKLSPIHDFLEANKKKPFFYANFDISLLLTYLDDEKKEYQYTQVCMGYHPC